MQGIQLRALRTAIGIAAWGVLTWGLVHGVIEAGSASATQDQEIVLVSGMSAVAEWLRNVQFIPAAMTFSLSTIIVWVLVTLVMGRVYCSTVCPLGAWQDAWARLGRSVRRNGFERRNYRYSRPLTPWRTSSLAVFVVAVLLGIGAVVSLLDPWAIYSEACDRYLLPAWQWVESLMSDAAVRIATASVAGMIVSGVLMAGISVLAFRNGRTFCNSVCPVGTALGYVSRYSLLHIDIDTDLCTQCRRCEHVCKAACINLNDHVVDGSRCVNCFNCLTACRDGAIRYTISRKALSTPLMQRLPGQQVKSPQTAGAE